MPLLLLHVLLLLLHPLLAVLLLLPLLLELFYPLLLLVQHRLAPSPAVEAPAAAVLLRRLVRGR